MGRVHQATGADGYSSRHLSAGRPGRRWFGGRARPGAGVFPRQNPRIVSRGGAGRDRQRQAAPVSRAGSVERGLRARGHGPVVHVYLSLIMNPPVSIEIGSQIIMLFAALMLVLQLLLVVQRMFLINIRLFALQSLMLSAIAAVVAYYYNATHVYIVAVLTLVGKVIFLPWLLNRLVRRINIVQEIEPLFNAPTSMLICGGLTLLGYLVARPFTTLE